MENAVLTTKAIKAQLKGLEAGRFLNGQLISLAGCGKLYGKGTSSIWLERNSNAAFCSPDSSETWSLLKLNETELLILKGGEYGPSLGVCEDRIVRLVSDDIFCPFPAQDKVFRFKLFDMSVIAFIGSNGKYLRADDFLSYSQSGAGYWLRATSDKIDKRSLWFIGVAGTALRAQNDQAALLNSVEKLGDQLAGLREYGIAFTEEELMVLAQQAGIVGG